VVSGRIAGGAGIAGWIGTVVVGLREDAAAGGCAAAPARGSTRSPFDPQPATMPPSAIEVAATSAARVKIG
jgi:hypothetical protein